MGRWVPKPESVKIAKGNSGRRPIGIEPDFGPKIFIGI